MASSNSSSQSNAFEKMTIQQISENLSSVYKSLEKVDPMLLPASTQEKKQHCNTQKNGNNGDDEEKDNGSSSKKDRGWFKIRKNKHKIKEVEENSSNNHKSNFLPDVNAVGKLRNELSHMISALKKLKEFEDDLGKPIQHLNRSIDDIVQTHSGSGSIPTEKLREIEKEIFNLKIKMSSVHIFSSIKSDARHLSTTIGSNANNATDESSLPNLHLKDKFKESSFFKEFRVMFDNLDIKSKLCLLCFAVFPEGAVIKKRLLVHWWIGERLLDPNTPKGKTVEDNAHEILEDFMKKGFIKPVNQKDKQVANSFKMHTLVHSSVIMLAHEEGFFHYNPEGNPTSNIYWCNRACLVHDQKLATENREYVKTLFNVSKQILDFTLEWFSKMRRLRVLYLGRWQSSGKNRHVEVESTEFLKGLKFMEDLRLLSLCGISGIRELPNSISKLRSLRILDLRACYNLENIPKEVASLNMLIYLDISECYLLDYMPKELLSLSQLQVLKGFVITDTKHRNFCSLDDLAGLKKLQKLSINVNSEAFSLEELWNALQKLKQLLKLKVAWGAESLQAKPDKNSKQMPIEARKKGNEGDNKKKDNTNAAISTNREKNKEGQEQDKGATRPNKATYAPRSATSRFIERSYTKLMGAGSKPDQESSNKLEKLDIQCFPQETLPTWLSPKNMKSLKRLYFRGGRLNSLDAEEGNEKWAVEVLRFKYMNELKVSWNELQELFPKLEYFEKFNCPKVILCPCDGSGEWLR